MLNAHLFFMQQGAAQADQLAQDVPNVQKIDPDFWAVHAALGILRVHQKDDSGALREYERAVELSGGMPLALQQLGQFHAIRGNRREAAEVVARLKQRPYPPPIYIAGLYRRLGDEDRILEWLERGFKERDGAMIDLLSPLWGEARKTNPRIQDLVRRMTEAKR